jgi:tetratricopeptide (TPR) repeat protein
MKRQAIEKNTGILLIRKIILLMCILLTTGNFSFSQQSLSNYFKGLAAIETNQLDEAKICFENALQDGVKPSLIHTRLGEIYFDLKDFSAALKEFIEAEKTDPTSNAYNIARCYASLNNPASATESIHANLKSAHPVPYFQIQKEPAFQTLKSSLQWSQLWSQNQYSPSEANLNEAYYLVETRQFDDAIALINSILEKRPKFAEAIFLRGQAFLQLKEFAFASEDFSTASGLKPANDAYHFQEALARTGNNQYKKAVKCIEKAIEINPYNPDYIYTKSLILFKDDKLDEASEGIKYYAGFFGYQEKAKLLLAKVLVEQNNLDQALEISRVLIQDKQGGDEAYFIRGMIYQLKNLYPQAIDDYGMALDINPKDPLCYLNRGNCYLQIQAPEKACEDFNKALQLGYKNAYLLIREYCSSTTF